MYWERCEYNLLLVKVGEKKFKKKKTFMSLFFFFIVCVGWKEMKKKGIKVGENDYKRSLIIF